MTRERCILIDSPSEWKDALQGIEHAFAHTWESCYAMYLSTKHKTYLYCYETEGARIVCPISEREFQGYVDIVTPFGFSGFVGNTDYDDFPSIWSDYVKGKGYVCGFITLNPILKNTTYWKQEEAQRYNDLFVMDLTLNKKELFSGLDRNRRRQIRSWEQTKTSLIFDKKILSDFFLANYADFFQSKNASRVYIFSKETISFLFSLDNVLLVGTGKPDRVEAVSVFAFTPHVAEHLFNISISEGKHHFVGLIWYGVQLFKAKGIPFLNLGGGVREGDSIADFKQRFGARKIALKSLKQVYRPEIYEQLCSLANRDPVDHSGYFPAYRSR